VGRVGLFSAHTSGIGLAILAQMRNAEIEAAFPKPFIRRAVLADVRASRKRGYAVARREDGGVTIGLPLRGSDAAAIGLAGRLKESDYDTLADALRDAADRISTQVVAA